MVSTSYWPRLDLPAGDEDPFEELRAAYYTRLRRDRTNLLALRIQLLDAEQVSAPPYASTRRVAHAMAGAAAVFQATEVMNAAIQLEQAASRTAEAGEVHTAPAVIAALDALTNLLQKFVTQ